MPAPPRIRNLISQTPGNGGVCVGWLADNGPSDPTETGKLQWDFGMAIDALLDKMWWGIAARFPGIGTSTALPYLSKDRGIIQGISESDAAFATRLSFWRDSKRWAGNARALLQQAIGYAGNVRARTVDDSSNWCTYVPGDNPALFGPSTYRPAVANWEWDSFQWDPIAAGHTTSWWRFWLVLYSTSTSGANWAGAPGKWGSGRKWGAGQAWGIGLSSSVGKTLQVIARQWKRAGAWCRWIIVSLDDTLFDPFQTADDVHNPAQDFAHWSKIVAGQYVPARFANARYGDGVATNGIPTGFPYY